MRPYQLKSLTDTTYGIYFCGIFLREVDPFDGHYYATKQVNRANDLFDMQLRNKNER